MGETEEPVMANTSKKGTESPQHVLHTPTHNRYQPALIFTRERESERERWREE